MDLLHKFGTHKEELGNSPFPTQPHTPKQKSSTMSWSTVAHWSQLCSTTEYMVDCTCCLTTFLSSKQGAISNSLRCKKYGLMRMLQPRTFLAIMWSLGQLKTPLGVMETISGSPAFYINRYILWCFVLLGQQHNMISIPKESFPTLRSYTHSQFQSFRDFQRSNMHCFNQAMITLAAKYTAINYEALQHY